MKQKKEQNMLCLQCKGFLSSLVENKVGCRPTQNLWNIVASKGLWDKVKIRTSADRRQLHGNFSLSRCFRFPLNVKNVDPAERSRKF